MEKDNNQSSLKLKGIIETLQKEKEDLNLRLIRANHSKLSQVKVTEGQDEELDSEQSKAKASVKLNESSSIFVMGTGIITTMAKIDHLIPQKTDP